MNPIILVAETGSDLPPELASKYNIKIVPMHVSFDNETLDDGSFLVEKIYDYYHTTGNLPRTSGCSPEDFIRAFDDIHEQYPESQILYNFFVNVLSLCCYSTKSCKKMIGTECSRMCHFYRRKGTVATVPLPSHFSKPPGNYFFPIQLHQFIHDFRSR